MATALNVFRTVTGDLTTGDVVLYTAPTRKSGIFLSVQAANTTNTDVKTALAKNFKIPAGDSMAIIAAGSKLVLESGQKVYASASANNAVQLLMSILESAND